MEKIKAGIIGYGQRSVGMMRLLFQMPEKVDIVAVCDLYPDRVADAQKAVKEALGYDCYGTSDVYELIDHPEVNTVYIFASWEAHIPLAIYAMKAGKAVACEVAGAYSIEQCWDLVKTYEQTKTPIMMLENCCYGKRELMCLNMAQQGFFGQIVHMDGAYCHDLRSEISDGNIIRHYRLRNYINRNCENYPTHEIGPIARVLGINHGNRFLSVSSFSSKAAGLEQYIKDRPEKYPDLQDQRFNQGDVVTTVLTCAGGQTVRLTLETTIPRFYTRQFSVHGTKGSYFEDNDSIFEDGNEAHLKDELRWKPQWGNAEQYEEKYLHPLWVEYIATGIKRGHGGMDWLALTDFADSLLAGKPMPIDVYDMATWMAITALSEQSIAQGGAPVAFPDFTNGKWVL